MSINKLGEHFPILYTLISSLIAKIPVLCFLFSDQFPQILVSFLYVFNFIQVFIKFLFLLFIVFSQIAFLFFKLCNLLISECDLVGDFPEFKIVSIS